MSRLATLLREKTTACGTPFRSPVVEIRPTVVQVDVLVRGLTAAQVNRSGRCRGGGRGREQRHSCRRGLDPLLDLLLLDVSCCVAKRQAALAKIKASRKDFSRRRGSQSRRGGRVCTEAGRIARRVLLHALWGWQLLTVYLSNKKGNQTFLHEYIIRLRKTVRRIQLFVILHHGAEINNLVVQTGFSRVKCTIVGNSY